MVGKRSPVAAMPPSSTTWLSTVIPQAWARKFWATRPIATRAAVSRALARSSTGRDSEKSYFCMPARSAWPGRGRVSGALRATDRLGRFGGEEFVAVLPATDLAAAVAVAERVVASVRSLPVLPDRPRCTVSVGVAAVQADDARFDQVLGRADAALYLAKNRGRDQVAIHASAAPVFE